MTNNSRKRTPPTKKPSKKKGFDCIAFKRRAQARIHRKIKGMTREEELAYWNRPADGPLEIWWQSIQAHSASVRKARPLPDDGSGRN